MPEITDVRTVESAKDMNAKKAAKEERRRVLATLAELGGRLTAEEDVVFQGSKLVLPETMTLPSAVKFLTTKIAEDENEMQFSRTFNYRPWDGARAAMHAFKRIFGMMQQSHTYNMWGDKVPPNLIDIPVGPDETEQIPWGKITLPILPGCEIYTHAKETAELGSLFALTVKGPRKFRFEIEGLFRMVAEELETNSMYRGKAFDGQGNPEFLDLTGVDPERVIYSEDVLTQFEANVWSLLRYPGKMRELGMPLKRAILLEGPFGCGKTLGAYLTAQIAVGSGWSFIYCRPGRDDLLTVMSTARLYQPSVVFFEDVDTIASPDEASDDVTRVLDVFDGINAKGTEIVCVLTTNHPERIHKGMVRPGRLDAVIHIDGLDQEGIVQLIKVTVPAELLADDIDWDKVSVAMDGFLPAFCKEAIDRTMRYSLARNQGRVTKLTTDDFVAAADGLRPQLSLMEEAIDTRIKVPFETAFRGAVRSAVSDMDVVYADEREEVFAKIHAGNHD